MAYQSHNFQDAAEPLINDAEQNLLSLEKTPGDKKLTTNCAIALRTIQGVANLFTLDNITRLTALTADGLDASCRLNTDTNPALIAVAITLLDHLRQTGVNDLDDRTTHNLTAALPPLATKTAKDVTPQRAPADTRILVVDDEVVNRVLLGEFIKTFNKDIQVTSVDSASEGIYHYLTSEFDLVFLDIMMPDVDGNHFLSIVEKNKAAHNISGNPNIVVQTAVQSMDELLRIVNNDSVLEVIRKPIVRDRIYTCIKRYCQAFNQ